MTTQVVFGTVTLVDGTADVPSLVLTSDAVVVATHQATNDSTAVGSLQVDPGSYILPGHLPGHPLTRGSFTVNSLNIYGEICESDESTVGWVMYYDDGVV